MSDPLVLLFAFTNLVLAGAIVASCFVHLQERSRVGEVLDRVRGGRTMRIVVALLVLGVQAYATVEGEHLHRGLSLPLLGLALGFVLLRPSRGDRVCGTRGVRCGWSVLSHRDLEEWRLNGDHLRFRLRGEWESVGLPHGLHERVEPHLREVAPDRESPFK